MTVVFLVRRSAFSSHQGLIFMELARFPFPFSWHVSCQLANLRACEDRMGAGEDVAHDEGKGRCVADR
ncbi:hypothetical protein COMA2_20023 [Candidatus Nitrospira nitrificans]|uniref:Uncharacterized protein n=1 Tax=Candidatus Nitrospira nitrificans TaxID=1742973 RepID=A0A0S4LG53_9BACT|nr:hypothetical protein COMA2_20023 [Candidatus Nitrospira nitrificans]